MAIILVFYPTIRRGLDPEANLDSFYVVISVYLILLIYEADKCKES